MKTKLISSSIEEQQNYGAGEGTTERHEYECPCGKGKIIEEHDNIPGFREHNVWIECQECLQKYKIDESAGTRNWIIKEKETI